MFTLKLNKISFDRDGIINDMMPYIKMALEYAEEELIEEMKNEIDQVSGAPHDWRDMLKEDIAHLKEEITSDMITYFVGPEYDQDPEDPWWMRAMVIGFGNKPPIYAGPKGRIVWDNDLIERTESKIPYKREIPKTWYHEGRNYIENSIKNIRSRYSDLVMAILNDMPVEVFSNNIIVKEG